MENVLYLNDLIDELQKLSDKYGNKPVFIRVATNDSGHSVPSSVKILSTGVEIVSI